MAEGSAENQIVQKNNKKTVWIMAAVIILLLATIASLIFAFVHAQKDDDNNVSNAGSIRGIIQSEEDIQDLIDQLRNDKVKSGYFETEMTNNWEFANGTAASENAYVGNSKSNLHPMYFDLIRDDTGETIYSSPVMPVGTHLDNIVLDKNLPAGNYNCTMIHHFLDDNYIETGETVKLGILMTVRQ